MIAPSPKPILLVEDNADDIDLTLLALKEARVLNDVIVAKDGAEALDYLFGTGVHKGRDTSNLPQVVLLDLKLPKIDGHEVLRRLRASPITKYVPVVVLTTSKEDQDIIESYDRGANSFIRKPVDFGNFMEAIRQLSLYWLVLNVKAEVEAQAAP